MNKGNLKRKKNEVVLYSNLNNSKKNRTTQNRVEFLLLLTNKIKLE